MDARFPRWGTRGPVMSVSPLELLGFAAELQILEEQSPWLRRHLSMMKNQDLSLAEQR
jgi:hypothetical protein